MENFIVSARKYRPTTFDTVVGQESITSTLKNAIRTNHLSQSYLFCGPRGVGKTTCARILAKTINCQNISDNVEACDKCESCLSFNSSRSFNIHELDAASNNKVDDIRTLTDQVRIPPQVGKYSIYIIDEVHMLSTSAFNAFLKTLEEPPSHAIFILATTEKQKIIPTILSRCQIFDFHRITIDDISERLAFVAASEGIQAEKEGLHIIAQKADGAMRDALSIFDQIVSYSGSSITYANVIENLNVLDYEYYLKMTDSFLNGDVSSALLLFNEILDKGFDGHNFITGLSSHMRNLLVCKDDATIKLLEVGSSIRDRYRDQTAGCTQAFLFSALDILAFADINFRNTRNQRLHVELTLIKLCNLNHIPVENTKKNEILTEASVEESPAASSTKPEPQPLTEKPGAKPDPATASEKAPVVEEKKSQEGHDMPPKPTSVQHGSSRSFSIREKLKEESEEIKDEDDGGEDDPGAMAVAEEENVYEPTTITDDRLLDSWSRVAEAIPEVSPRFISFIKSISPALSENNEILLPVKTEAQKEYIDNQAKQQMVQFLRKDLGNDSISIVTRVTDDESEEKPYTSDQKYNHLKNINPELDNFKKDFMLDFD